MAVIFEDRNIVLLEGEVMPEHVDAFPHPAILRAPELFHLSAVDAFTSKEYSIAINISDEETAELLLNGARRAIRQGDMYTGRMCDTAYIIKPEV